MFFIFLLMVIVMCVEEFVVLFFDFCEKLLKSGENVDNI